MSVLQYIPVSVEKRLKCVRIYCNFTADCVAERMSTLNNLSICGEVMKSGNSVAYFA